MEKDNKQPVEQRHVDFAQEVVALARKHGIRDLKVEFYGGRDGEPWTRISASWHQGRHGETNRIALRAEAVHHAPEKGNGE